MENLVVKNPNAFDYIRDIILKYCPRVDNRLPLMGSASTSPELEIHISLKDDSSNVYFMYGTSNHKTSTPDRIDVNRSLTIEEITSLIDFLLQDHESIAHIDLKKSTDYLKEGTNEVIMLFKINWRDESLKGLLVNDITLKINLGKNNKLANDYALVILNRYQDVLSKTPSFRKMKDLYLSKVKKDYIESLSKEELLEFVNNLHEEDLRELLIGMDNKVFENYFRGNDDTKRTP